MLIEIIKEEAKGYKETIESSENITKEVLTKEKSDKIFKRIENKHQNKITIFDLNREGIERLTLNYGMEPNLFNKREIIKLSVLAAFFEELEKII